jgi:hypothetical protein
LERFFPKIAGRLAPDVDYFMDIHRQRAAESARMARHGSNGQPLLDLFAPAAVSGAVSAPPVEPLGRQFDGARWLRRQA